VAATEANKKIVEQERQAHLRREAKEVGEAQDLAKLLSRGHGDHRAGRPAKSDQLFGSVTAKDIAEALRSRNFTIDRRKIQLDEPIKQLGEHKITVRLHREVPVEVTVHVVKDE